MRRYMDIYGKPVERTPEEYPYSYSQFCVWKGRFSKTTHTLYSDRMLRDTPEKFRACCVRVWDQTGQLFYGREPEKIEEFLCAYLGTEIELTGIEEGCNAFNGYPYWVFHFRCLQSIPVDGTKLTGEDLSYLKRAEELDYNASADFMKEMR